MCQADLAIEPFLPARTLQWPCALQPPSLPQNQNENQNSVLPAGHCFVPRLARDNQCPLEHARLGNEKANTPSAAVARGTAPVSAALAELTGARLSPSSAKVQMILVFGDSSYSGR